MSKHQKGAFRVGRPGRHEAAADVEVGQFDQMSVLASMVGVPLCGLGHFDDGETRLSFCTRPAGHNEQDSDGKHGGSVHPSHKHVAAGADGTALAVWR